MKWVNGNSPVVILPPRVECGVVLLQTAKFIAGARRERFVMSPRTSHSGAFYENSLS